MKKCQEEEKKGIDVIEVKKVIIVDKDREEIRGDKGGKKIDLIDERFI